MTPPLADRILCLLATRAASAQSLVVAVEAAIRGGVDVVQVREKELDDDAFAEQSGRLAAVCAAHRVPLIVNDRVEVAARIDARGVHVGQDDTPVADARRGLPHGALVGVSTHDETELAAALMAGADYVGVGAVFGTSTKGRAVPEIGPAAAASLCARAEAAGVPAFAIGGITTENVARLAAAGIRRAAVCAGILGSDDPEAAARAIRRALVTPLRAGARRAPA